MISSPGFPITDEMNDGSLPMSFEMRREPGEIDMQLLPNMLASNAAADEITGRGGVTKQQRRKKVSGNLRKVYGLASALILTGAMAGCATYGSGINSAPADAKMTANVQALIDRHPDLGANSISVQTVDRVVYLHGMASTGLERREAESVAGEAPGVARVVNLIAVTR
jgi:hypothetical protein